MKHRAVLLCVLLAACGGEVKQQGRLMCRNKMVFAQTHAESVKVLDEVAYQSALDGQIRCGNLDSLTTKKP